MVYCGKPSKGCSSCRERKIRCDQREPGCGQCEKKHQPCPGYRNLVDLMFRDESSHVIKKARKARTRKRTDLGGTRPATPSDSEGRLSVTPEPRAKPLSLLVPVTPASSSPADRDDVEHSDDSSMLMSPASDSWPVTPAMVLEYGLSPACQEQGVAYFFSRYVAMAETVSHQRFDFLRDVWKPLSSAPDRQVDGVLASMTAVGLMGLASTTKSADLMAAAGKSYGTALTLTMHALQPAEAVKDSTMLSVLILGVFEMTKNTPQASAAEGFRNHVNGAVAIAKVRGTSQFQTRAGRRMFSMLCQRVVVSCAQQNTPMPDSLLRLCDEMAKTLNPANPHRRLMALVSQILQVRSDIKSCRLTDAGMIVAKLLAIEAEFENLTRQLPPPWRCRTLKVTRQHPAVFGDVCHLYASHHHANLWSSILACRILVLETIISEISKDLSSCRPRLDPNRYLDELCRAQRKLRRLVHAVTASIPQQLGLMNAADGSINGHDPGSMPITTVEILQTPSPPTSPSTSWSSDSGSAVYSPASCTSPSAQPRKRAPSGPTILDITCARDPADEAERYMLLVSATSPIVWPLFVVGMSTACSREMRAYAVGRLRTLYMETGIRQADAVANLLEEREMTGQAVAAAAAAAVELEWSGMGLSLEETETETESGVSMPGMGQLVGLGVVV